MIWTTISRKKSRGKSGRSAVSSGFRLVWAAAGLHVGHDAQQCLVKKPSAGQGDDGGLTAINGTCWVNPQVISREGRGFRSIVNPGVPDLQYLVRMAWLENPPFLWMILPFKLPSIGDFHGFSSHFWLPDTPRGAISSSPLSYLISRLHATRPIIRSWVRFVVHQQILTYLRRWWTNPHWNIAYNPYSLVIYHGNGKSRNVFLIFSRDLSFINRSFFIQSFFVAMLNWQKGKLL